MGYLGLEPRTIRLKAEYSTIELATLTYLHNIIPWIYKKRIIIFLIFFIPEVLVI